MSEPIVFLNGEYVPESAARISIFDRGVCAGDGIYDVARTFGHKPFKLAEHCKRLCRSALYTKIGLPYSAQQLEEISIKVLEKNLSAIDRTDDLVLWIVATRGMEPPSRNPLDATTPTVMVYTLPLNYQRYVKCYEVGAHLIAASTRRTPADCLDPRAKIINKMNHFLAELEVKSVDRDAVPLMLGTDGSVAESSAANLFFVTGGRLFTPRSNILRGITRETVIELARKAKLEVIEGDFYPYDITTADEVFLTTTTYSILPVGRFNGRTYNEVPGPVTARLMGAWSSEIGFDFVEQARKHAR